MEGYKIEKVDGQLVTRFNTPMIPTRLVKEKDTQIAGLTKALDSYLDSHQREKLKVPHLILMFMPKRRGPTVTEYKYAVDVIANALMNIFKCAREQKAFNYDEHVTPYTTSNKTMIHNVIQHFLISRYHMMLHLAESKEAKDGSIEYHTIDFDQTYSGLFQFTHADFLLTNNHTELKNSNYMEPRLHHKTNINPLSQLQID